MDCCYAAGAHDCLQLLQCCCSSRTTPPKSWCNVVQLALAVLLQQCLTQPTMVPTTVWPGLIAWFTKLLTMLNLWCIVVQLALVLLLRQLLPNLQQPPQLYDPAFTAVDKLLMQHVRLEVIQLNEECRRQADVPTLFYLPHLEVGEGPALLLLLSCNQLWHISTSDSYETCHSRCECGKQRCSMCQ